MADFQITRDQKHKVRKFPMRCMFIYKKWILALLLTSASSSVIAQQPNDNKNIEDEIIYKRMSTSITPPLATVFDRESGRLDDISNVNILANHVPYLLDIVYPNKSLTPPECQKISWTIKCIDKIERIANTSPEASYVTAILYAAGKKDPSDLSNGSKSVSYMERAASGGLPSAEYLLARYVANGAPGLLEKDTQRASNLIRSSAQKGYLSAKLHLALDMFRAGQALEAFHIIERVKDESHDASFMYATAKLYGTGADRNLTEARTYFERLNSDKAIYNASVMTLYGLGGEQNVSKGMANLEMLAGSRNGASFDPAVRNIGYFRKFAATQTNTEEKQKMLLAAADGDEVDQNCPEIRKKPEQNSFTTEVFVFSLPLDRSIDNIIRGVDAVATFIDRSKSQKPVATCVKKKVYIPRGNGNVAGTDFAMLCKNNYTGKTYWGNQALYEGPVFWISETSDSHVGGKLETLTPNFDDDRVGTAYFKYRFHCNVIIEDKEGTGFCWRGADLFRPISMARTLRQQAGSNQSANYGRQKIFAAVGPDGKWRGGAMAYGAHLLSAYDKTLVVAVEKTSDSGFYCDYVPPPTLKF